MESLRQLTVATDRVFLSFLVNQLDQEGIDAVVFDDHTSAALGFAVDGLGVRVCVTEADYDRARWVLAEVAPDVAARTGEGDDEGRGTR